MTYIDKVLINNANHQLKKSKDKFVNINLANSCTIAFNHLIQGIQYRGCDYDLSQHTRWPQLEIEHRLDDVLFFQNHVIDEIVPIKNYNLYIFLEIFKYQ